MMQTPTQKLPDVVPITDIRKIHQLEHYVDIPSDWFIAVTDIMDSTTAIQAGNYKAVNSIATTCITAVLNALSAPDLPFAFGGDGASMLIPADGYQQAANALYSVQELAQTAFGLQLRIGLIPVQDVLDAGYVLKVGKLQLAEEYAQSIFTGGGLSYAEKLLKRSSPHSPYLITEGQRTSIDLSGFECRWTPHPAQHDEVVSILIEATSKQIETRHQMYAEVLGILEMIYGDARMRHPIDARRAYVSHKAQDYSEEVALKHPGQPLAHRPLRLMLATVLQMWLAIFAGNVWGRYKRIVQRTTDHEKFDDMLRLTISGTSKQRETFESFLLKRYSQGKLTYGLHTSDASIMTCMIFERFGRQVHFLDGADGGYAQAATMMKARPAIQQAT